jgi:hypothetical protein
MLFSDHNNKMKMISLALGMMAIMAMGVVNGMKMEINEGLKTQEITDKI